MALFAKEPEKNPRSQAATNPLAAAAAELASSPATPGPTPTTAGRPAGSIAGEGRAYLDRGSKISGKIFFEGPARVDGEIDGEINAKDSLTIGETAAVTAQIRAASVAIAGKVSGDIVATQRIEIRPAAKVNGNIAAPVLVIHEGAMFEGHCSMQPEGAREDRKVTVFPKEERMAQAAGGQKQA
ncbi:MAG TPA: polymer-forming cytoskeletal protein [Candidatus Binataceae bacterium]|nr:polymer-forming cytoskeletal protein [Candidatus Binataceae bacterium]